jgi:phosphoglycolate phosphatase
MKLVIFDCDGTLVDSQVNIVAAMAYAFESEGLTPPPRSDVLGVVGLSLPEAFAVLASNHSLAIQAALANHYRGAFSASRGRDRGLETLYPGIKATIEALAAREDVVLGVATGKSRRGVARLFDHEGWHPYFRTIQTADDNPSKPDPSMILKAMSDAAVGPEATIMVGDTTFDMIMARAAKVRALGVAWGYHAERELVEAGAQAIVSDGARLLDAIDALLGLKLEPR